LQVLALIWRLQTPHHEGRRGVNRKLEASQEEEPRLLGVQIEPGDKELLFPDDERRECPASAKGQGLREEHASCNERLDDDPRRTGRNGDHDDSIDLLLEEKAVHPKRTEDNDVILGTGNIHGGAGFQKDEKKSGLCMFRHTRTNGLDGPSLPSGKRKMDMQFKTR
jgi:hypothetical protein